MMLDLVDVTGWRPAPLSHHRTCGPASGGSNQTMEAGLEPPPSCRLIRISLISGNPCSFSQRSVSALNVHASVPWLSIRRPREAHCFKGAAGLSARLTTSGSPPSQSHNSDARTRFAAFGLLTITIKSSATLNAPGDSHGSPSRW